MLSPYRRGVSVKQEGSAHNHKVVAFSQAERRNRTRACESAPDRRAARKSVDKVRGLAYTEYYT